MENERKVIRYQTRKYDKLENLIHYVNKETLKEQHRKQEKNKASGIDKITKEIYEEQLEENIENLIERMKKFSYKPLPVRRVYIPKINGKLRPLGIPAYEDKLLQGIMAEVLEEIYESKFLNCSFGFRKNRNCHQAIREINQTIRRNILVRYCDDFIIMFEYQEEAKIVYEQLVKRFEYYGLEVEESKTSIIPFGRFKGTKDTFDFLGFMHYNGITRTGKYTVGHKISNKKKKDKQNKITKWIKEHRTYKLKEMIKCLIES